MNTYTITVTTIYQVVSDSQDDALSQPIPPNALQSTSVVQNT